jgi:hypothetical protein
MIFSRYGLGSILMLGDAPITSTYCPQAIKQYTYLDGGTYTNLASRVGSTLTLYLMYSSFNERHMVAMLAGVKPRKQ